MNSDSSEIIQNKKQSNEKSQWKVSEKCPFFMLLFVIKKFPFAIEDTEKKLYCFFGSGGALFAVSPFWPQQLFV